VTIGEGKRRCGSPRATDGEPCLRPAGDRTNHLGYGPCYRHAGNTPTVSKHWVDVKNETEAHEAVRTLGWEPIGNPYPVLADALGEIVAFKDYWRGEFEQETKLTTWSESGEQLSAKVQAYERGLALTLKAAEVVGKLDLSARALQFEQALSAAEAAWLGGVLEGVLVEAGLTSQVVSVVLAGLGRRLAQDGIAG
jgi:hypothetical protein